MMPGSQARFTVSRPHKPVGLVANINLCYCGELAMVPLQQKEEKGIFSPVPAFYLVVL